MMDKPEESRNLQPEFWNELYRSDRAGWDLGSPTPAFLDLLETKRLVPGKMLVLGSGKGYDAILFAQHGFDVTAIDSSEEANKFARQLATEQSMSIEFVQEDMFDYSLGIAEEFDYVLEYVTFCAIDPSLRPEFAAMIPSLMKDAGRFIALFFPLDDRPGGPPFAVSMDEVSRLFGKKMVLISLEAPQHSVTPRKGKELLTIWRKQ